MNSPNPARQPGGQPAEEYPGQRLGLPKDGPGSVAGWGRRVAALSIDWVMSWLVASVVTGRTIGDLQGANFAPTIVFFVEVWIFTSLLGSSAGQRIVGVMIVRTNGARLDPGRVFLRTVLILLVIPAVIFNPDQRGLHDLATDSVAVKR